MEGAKYVAEHYLPKITLSYKNTKDEVLKNHKWLTPQLRDFLQMHKMDKFDDIADTVLMLVYYKNAQ